MIRNPIFTIRDIVFLAILIRLHYFCYSIRILKISHHRYKNISMMTTLSAAESYLHTPQMDRNPGNATLLSHIQFQHAATNPSHRLL